MARPVGGGTLPRIALSPRARVAAGWLVALILVASVAFLVGRLGDQAGGPAGGTPSATAAGSPLPIAFGTVLGPDGQVDPASVTKRFGPGDTFAYSIDLAPPPSGEVFVEVSRAGNTSTQPVQTPAPQGLPPERSTVGFQVPAQALLDAFGPGEYLMRIYAEVGGALVGEGRFTLQDDGPSPS